MKSLSNLLEKHQINRNQTDKGKPLKEFGNACARDLTEKGYIHNEIFGWEKKEIIESFGLDPNMQGVPHTLQPKWVEKKINYTTDNYGNKIKTEPKTNWVPSQTEKKWYPVKNWLEYQNYKKDKYVEEDRKNYAQQINTPPTPQC